MTLELQKRIRDHFKWDPHPLAFIPPEFEGLAGPAFWLTYETPDEDQYVSRLYFVNGISEVLPKVLVGTGGWISVDEVVAPISAPIVARPAPRMNPRRSMWETRPNTNLSASSGSST